METVVLEVSLEIIIQVAVGFLEIIIRRPQLLEVIIQEDQGWVRNSIETNIILIKKQI